MAMNRYSFTAVSANKKTGPIPVTRTDAASCPSSCPLKGSGCYAESGPTTIHWRRLSNPGAGLNLMQLAEKIRQLMPGQLWRHNEAGDLAHDGAGNIDADALQTLIDANKGKRGFTYTHHNPMRWQNLDLIRWANLKGFTVNLSANNPAHADALVNLRAGPVCVTVSADFWQGKQTGTTPEGRTIVRCPAEVIDRMTCKDCGYCQQANRQGVIGFSFHGVSKNKARKAADNFTVIQWQSRDNKPRRSEGLPDSSPRRSEGAR